MKRYKLLNPDRTSYGGMTWPIGVWREALGDIHQPLCTDGWLHCYYSPELALLLNPIHANIIDPVLCEVETEGRSLTDWGIKCGYRKMRVLRDIAYTPPTTEQRVESAIRCALCVCHIPRWVSWAEYWLSGKDRSAGWAQAAAYAVRMLSSAAHYAADAASYAASAVTHMVDAADYAEIYTRRAAGYAARAAESASTLDVDIARIAKEVMSI